MKKYVSRSMVMLLVMVGVLGLLKQWLSLNYAMIYETVTNKVVTTETNQIIVLDPGHGGDDSGKVGVNGGVEKDINLSIVLKLKRNLEQMGYTVVLTRTDDQGLYDANSSHKKRDDMNKRVKIINESGGQLCVSIHQNSFTDSKYYGAQMFYYAGSTEGQVIAAYLQESIVKRIQPDNTRQIKSDDTYFIMKNAQIPVVIAECGFLSNAAEEALLLDENYKEKMAWAIAMGITQYLHEN